MMTTHKPIQTKVQSENLIHCENNEISLVDLSIVLVRRKKIIIVFMLISLLMAVGYLWAAKPVPIYEGTAIVQVGMVPTVDKVSEIYKMVSIEDLGILMQKLKAEYPYINVIKNSEVNFITIKMQAYTNTEIELKLKKIIDQLLQKHSILYNAMIAEQQKRQKELDFLNTKIKTKYYSRIAELEHLIKAIQVTEPAEASVIVLQKFKLLDKLLWLKEQVFDINSSITKMKLTSTPTKFIGEATVKDITVKLKVAKVILLGVIFGLMFGIISALIVEFIATVRRRMANLEK